MPVTLEQAKVGKADKVEQLVVDEFRRGSALLARLTFDNAVSPGTGGSTMTYGYTALKTPSLAEGRALNAEYEPGEAERTKRTTDLKIFGGAFQVDRVLEDTAAKSEIAFQLKEKIKAAKNKFHFDFINGDSAVDDRSFDGLDKLVSATSTEYTLSSQIDVSTAAAIETNAKVLVMELDKWFETMEGKPHMLLVNGRTKTILNAVARELKYYSESKDEFGKPVDNYAGIPLVDLEKYYNGAVTIDVVPIDENGVTSIYAVQLGLDSVHGVSPTGSNVIKTYLPDMKASGAVKKGEVELVAAMVVKSTLKAGAFRNLKVK